MVGSERAVSLGRIEVFRREGMDGGAEALLSLFQFCRQVVGTLNGRIAAGDLPDRVALSGRIRGTGPAVSFGGLVVEAERAHPLNLHSPFEGEDCVSGAVWDAKALVDDRSTDGIVKLRFEAGATTLPMHTHEGSARFIIVLEGRGFYHASDEPLDRFTGKQVRTIAVRERDAVLFTGGVVHTFSAFDSPLVLLSYHSPFIPLDDPRQYTLPEVRWTAKQGLRRGDARVIMDDAWSVLASATAG